MLENLLQDYKWNNPDLNSIKNNELIYKLQQIIKTEGTIQQRLLNFINALILKNVNETAKTADKKEKDLKK